MKRKPDSFLYIISFVFFLFLFSTPVTIFAAAPTAGLVGYWSFNEGSGTVVGDTSGNGNTATIVNSPTWTTGQIGSALSFNGVDSAVSLPNIISTQDLTFCAWVFAKPGSSGRFMSIVDNKRFGLYIDTFYNPSFSLHGSSDGSGNGNGGVFQANAWTHVCVSRTGTTGNFYVNGVPAGTNINFGTSSDGIGNPYFGQYGNVNQQSFYGLMDEARLYNRVLSDTEISAVYTDGGVTPPPPPGDTTPPSLSSITSSSITSTSATVSWNTDEASDSQVEYGVTQSYGSSSSLNSSLTTSHSTSLSGLTPSTIYHYRVKSKDASSNLSTGGDFTFTTSAVVTPPPPSGNIVTATSCNNTVTNPDVQNAINAVNDGGTVIIPAGTCSWTITVSVNPKALTIQGAGIDQTIIVDNVPKNPNPAVVVSISLQLGKKFRLTGMTFQGGPQGQDPNNFNYGTISITGNAHDFRLDHLKFVQPNSSAIRYGGDLWGVVDHSYFDLSNFKQGNVILNTSYGDQSFASPLTLGTEQAIYMEDNTFIGAGAAGAGPVDSFSGGRFVFRYNTVTNDVLATHGTETGGRLRGVRSYEIYNNTFTTNALLFTAIFLRGGTGTVFNNTVAGSGGQTGYLSVYKMSNFRSSDPRGYFFGFCNGTNLWDGNSQSSGYPCLDQLGRGQGDLLSGDNPINTFTGTAVWPRQLSEPLYAWNNAWSPVVNNATSLFGNDDPVVISENRDFFSNTQKPGYTPYVYPHPLVSGITPPPPGDTTAPSVPTGLTATAVSSSGINLTWTASTDAVGVMGYKIFRGGVQIATLLTNSYSNTGLTASTLYSYTVSAYDAAGNNSSQSTSASATTQAQQSGNTITATTCNQSDVQSAINAVTSGGTVIIPTGNCTWVNAVNINNKSLTLIGQGTANTIITDGTSKGDGNCQGVTSLIAANFTTDIPVRISGFTIIGQPAVNNCGESAQHIQISGATHQFRVDHMKITGQVTSINVSGDARGLIDHNTFNGPQNYFQTLVQHNSWQGIGNFGDNSWAQPDTLGQAGAVYIEDNTYQLTGSIFPTGCFDTEAGGRVVFRYNTGCPFVGMHGLDSSGRLRSGRQYEIYNNTFTAVVNSLSNMYTGVFLRGGTGMVFNNNFNDVAGSPYISLAIVNNYRDTNNAWVPWGHNYDGTGCDGRGDFDTNTGIVYATGNYNGAGGTTEILTDTTKSWTSNQWVGYSLINKTKGWGSVITSSSGNTITTQAAAQGTGHSWTSGDSYEIRKAYPCADQIGRGAGVLLSNYVQTPVGPVNQAADPLYAWLNKHNGVNQTGIVSNFPQHVAANRDYYDWIASFNGTTGVGSGILSARPSTCTVGVGYWATDTNTLYECYISNTWTGYYTPFTYPYPLTASGMANPSAGSGGGTVDGGLTPPPSDTTAPSTPSGLSATAVSSSAINLTWTASTDNAGVSGYKIFRNGTQITTSGTNSYSDTGLSPSTLYSYTVSAYDAAGNTSAQSASKSATTQSSSATPLTGDLNLDHIVNSLDFSLMNSVWLTSSATADIDHNSIVNSLDFSVLSSQWGQTW